MNEKQAIEVLNGNVNDINAVVIARAVAIKALEKQIPKKVAAQINDKDVKIGHVVFSKGTKVYICECGNRVLRFWKHCSDCGQLLDWGE